MDKTKIKVKVSGDRYVFYTMPNSNKSSSMNEYDYKVDSKPECSNCSFKQKCQGKTKPVAGGPCHNAYINRKLNKQIARRYAKINEMLCTVANKPKYFVTLNSELKLTEKNIKTAKYWLNRFAAMLKAPYPKLWFFYKIEICNKRLIHFHLALRPNKPVYSRIALDELVQRKWQSVCKINKKNCTNVEEYRIRFTRMYFSKSTKKELDKQLMLVLKNCHGFGIYGHAHNSTAKEKTYEMDKQYYDYFIKPITIDYVRALGKHRTGGQPNTKTIEMLNKGAGALNDISATFKRDILKALNKAPQYEKRQS